MIKLEIIKKKNSTQLIFETRVTTTEGLDELDMAFQALLGSEPKRGGYLDSNKFEIEVKDPE